MTREEELARAYEALDAGKHIIADMLHGVAYDGTMLRVWVNQAERALANRTQPQQRKTDGRLEDWIDKNQQQCPGCGHFLIDVSATQDLQKDSHVLSSDPEESGDLEVCAECLIAGTQPPIAAPTDAEPINLMERLQRSLAESGSMQQEGERE